ncbi:hypothetical protein K438DRAFT_1972185 [Mycena galopus ATCC 62051]|nr:hypothetical protein K438DRAFT_1972185 [Mycena galopus ATCC 62051]
MVWVSNYASVAIVVSVTNTTNGNGGDFTINPKQNETWSQNHWNRKGAETMKITWAGGKNTSFTVQKDDRVIIWDEAYGVEANVVTTMKTLLFTPVRAFEFELGVPAAEIANRTSVVQRPVLGSEPDAGNDVSSRCVVATFPTQLVFQSPTPVILENIVVRPSFKLLITSIQSPTLFMLDPGAANATLDEVCTFPNSTGLTGIVDYKPDVYGVVTSIFNVTAAAAIRGSIVIWSVDLTSGSPVAKRAAHPAEHTHERPRFLPRPPRSRQNRTSAWSPAPGPPAPPAIPIGSNGLRVGRDGLLYFTNSRRFGVLHTDLYDDFVFDNKGRAWVATHPGALQLFTPLANGTWVQETAVGDLAGSTLLNVPTAVAFGWNAREEDIRPAVERGPPALCSLVGSRLFYLRLQAVVLVAHGYIHCNPVPPSYNVATSPSLSIPA